MSISLLWFRFLGRDPQMQWLRKDRSLFLPHIIEWVFQVGELLSSMQSCGDPSFSHLVFLLVIMGLPRLHDWCWVISPTGCSQWKGKHSLVWSGGSPPTVLQPCIQCASLHFCSHSTGENLVTSNCKWCWGVEPGHVSQKERIGLSWLGAVAIMA